MAAYLWRTPFRIFHQFFLSYQTLPFRILGRISDYFYMDFIGDYDYVFTFSNVLIALLILSKLQWENLLFSSLGLLGA